MNLWQVLAFVVVCQVTLLIGVAIGAYAVYRTKREDGRFFNVKSGDEGKAFVLDDNINDSFDAGGMLSGLEKRNAKFQEQVSS